MVKVAAAVKVVAGVVCAGRLRHTSLVGKLVILADGVKTEFVSFSIVSLCREVIPVGGAVAVVDHHVFDNAGAELLECGNHRAQLRLVAKRRVKVAEPVDRVVAHRRICRRFACVRHPD